MSAGSHIPLCNHGQRAAQTRSEQCARGTGGRTDSSLREQLAICTVAARTAAACPPCASAAGHANQRCRTYSLQAPFSVLRRSAPYAHRCLLRNQGQIRGHRRDACWEPARRPMHQYTKRSKHSFTEAIFLQRQLVQRVC